MYGHTVTNKVEPKPGTVLTVQCTYGNTVTNKVEPKLGKVLSVQCTDIQLLINLNLSQVQYEPYSINRLIELSSAIFGHQTWDLERGGQLPQQG